MMGGDHGLEVTIPACIAAVEANENLHLLLVGDEAQIKTHLKHQGITDSPQLTVIHAPETVDMDELPSHALRKKKKSSMRVAINLVKEKQAEVCVSAGNTGALMATARFVLKTLPGIDRPGILADLPTRNGKTRVIDLGANVDSSAEHLFQFAVMGSALIKALDHKEKPTIAVLNVGVEEIKGNEQVKRTAQMLSDCGVMNYMGYVEGNDFYSGKADLVVCDGFVGNVALKSSEGLYKLIASVLKEAYSRNLWTKLIALLSRPVLRELKNKMDPARYNGATLLGLNGIVIKSHGSANKKAFQFAIEQAALQVENRVVDLVSKQISSFVKQGVAL